MRATLANSSRLHANIRATQTADIKHWFVWHVWAHATLKVGTLCPESRCASIRARARLMSPPAEKSTSLHSTTLGSKMQAFLTSFFFSAYLRCLVISLSAFAVRRTCDTRRKPILPHNIFSISPRWLTRPSCEIYVRWSARFFRRCLTPNKIIQFVGVPSLGCAFSNRLARRLCWRCSRHCCHALKWPFSLHRMYAFPENVAEHVVQPASHTLIGKVFGCNSITTKNKLYVCINIK